MFRFVRARFSFLFAFALGLGGFATVLGMPSLAHAQNAAVPKKAVPSRETAPAAASDAVSTQSITFSVRFIKPSELVSQLIPFASTDEKTRPLCAAAGPCACVARRHHAPRFRAGNPRRRPSRCKRWPACWMWSRAPPAS